jgi:Fe-S cluster assembly protein SufD
MVAASSPVEGFLTTQERLPSLGAPWADRLRGDNRERFARLGLPAPDDEAWRFTNLKRLRGAGFAVAPLADATPMAPVPGLDIPEFVLANGRWVAGGKEAVPGLQSRSLARVLMETPEAIDGELGAWADTTRHRFAALNTAHLMDGAVMRVARNACVDARILVTGPPARMASYPRLLILLEEGAKALVIEDYVGGDGFLCPVTEVHLGQGASLNHVRLDRSGKNATHLGLVAVRQERDSRYMSDVVALGSRLSRLDLDVSLAGEGGACVLNGLYFPVESQHMDHHTRVSHEAPHTTSRELYKGVLGGKGSAVFNGRIVIREGAVGVDAGQTNNNLLLSDKALVNTNPELEIFADDVKAQHGATIGQIEEEPLFYLQSRGIEEGDARRMLVEAFAEAMIAAMGPGPVQSIVRAELAGRF